MMLVWPFQEILAVLRLLRRLAWTRRMTPEADAAFLFSLIYQ